MNYVIGIDECGRGSAIGEMTICAVRAPTEWTMNGLADSKKLNANKRQIMNNQLINCLDISFCISSASNHDIDELGLGICLKKCYVEAINNLYQAGDQIIIDGNLSPKHLQEYGVKPGIENIKSVIKADTYIPVVMAASIIGKVYRDNIVINQYHTEFPCYNWNKNIGYLTKDHLDYIRKYGLSPLHRKSYNIKL